MGRFWLLKPVPQAALTLRPFLLMRSRRMELLLQSAPALRLWATQIAGTQLRQTDDSFTTPMRHRRTLLGLIGTDGSLTALPGTVVGSNPAGATNLDIA